MPASDMPDLNSPEFAAVKARLARAFLDHKGDLGALHASDEDIVARADEIAALLMGALARAMAQGNARWLAQYAWFTDLVNEMLDDRPGKPLDG
jgi:hypothetical protein